VRRAWHTLTGILTGVDIAQLSDHALEARVDGVNLYCRVNPAQKNRIILALKARGRVVGYLGDGINDAPALHSADVGLSVDTAVDVAKEAADLILLKPDLQVVHDGVLEGRRTFCQHPQVHYDGHELEFRQHVQHPHEDRAGMNRCIPEGTAFRGALGPALDRSVQQ
jgi:hypothetical protein